MRLNGKVAIVTGAGSGFGEGIARRFAQEGAAVVVNDINTPAGERVASGISGAGGIASFLQADVTRGEDWARLVAEAERAYGRLDIVVNNAGWTHRNKPYLDVGEAEFDKVYAINVKSVYLSAIHAVPVFRRMGGGCFVNIASTAGLRRSAAANSCCSSARTASLRVSDVALTKCLRSKAARRRTTWAAGCMRASKPAATA